MTPRPATLERIVFVLALLAVSLHAAPMFGSSSFDVEMVDEPEADDVDDIIRSSMVTPFPAITPGQADEPNFFWSGSGDDPDAGMTYWITTTVYKTALVTLTPTSPKTVPPSPTPVTIKPTPPITIPTPTVWPEEASEPRYWIRTVLRSSANENAPSFRRAIESNLSRLFAGLLGSRLASDGVHVLLRNVTRRNEDVELIYALSSWPAAGVGGHEEHVMIEPYLAAGAARIGAAGVNVTRELCRQRDAESLCQSVVTRAEPFVRADEAAKVAETDRRYWIAGIVVGCCLLVALVVVVLVYAFVRAGKRSKKQDAAVGSPSATLVDTATQSKLSRPASVIRKPAVAHKSSQKSASPVDGVEEHPDPWLRKARSTSKKHSRSKRTEGKLKRSSVRPFTAPDGRRSSISSLSGVISGSSSHASSVDRLDYQLSSEEPFQSSRGARRLKNKPDSFSFSKAKSKKMARSESLPSDRAGSPKTPESAAPVPQPRRLISAIIETETQEITADFSDVPDKSDDEPDNEVTVTSVPKIDDETMWKPGSLIPTKISNAVFGGPRKVCSAPMYLQGGPSPERGDSQPKRAWSSSDPIKPPEESDAGIAASAYPMSLFDPAPAPVPGQREDSPLRNPSLHVHSSSFPTWPAIGDTDPAIELIRSIKEELKKFDHQDR